MSKIESSFKFIIIKKMSQTSSSSNIIMTNTSFIPIITTLSDDELLYILSFLSQKDWLSLKLVSKSSFRLSHLSDHDKLWEPFYRKYAFKLIEIHQNFSHIDHCWMRSEQKLILNSQHRLTSSHLQLVQDNFKNHLLP